MDCPYYEQLQYAGDTRIQALVSLYSTGDARLMKNAIAQLDDSRTAEGATMSRAPTRQQQYIPPFSLWWIGMVHDYYMYVDDRGVRPRDAAGRAGGAAVLRAAPEGERVAGTAAVVELRGLDERVAQRRAAARGGRIERAARPAAAARVRLGRAAGSATWARRRWRHEYARRGGQAARQIRPLYWDDGQAALRRHARATSSSRSTPTCSRCWPASRRATRRATW